MKKYSLILVKFTVGFTILLGVLLILFANERSFKKIVNDDIENISKLSSSIIYSEIDNSLTKPIFVSLTMANDLFLKNWLAEEYEAGGDPLQTDVIQKYLMNYIQKYDYDSVALTSSKSNVYYYQEGINKIVSTDDPHDIWYYNFIESGKSYDLDVDLDETNSNKLTVFVNCRITDDDNNLVGVVAVGIKMIHLQALLRQYESEYDLKASLISDDGMVQVDSIDENIETHNFFSDPSIFNLKEDILSNKTSMQTFWYLDNGYDHCLITKYVPDLDWYIVIEKNTSLAQQLLSKQINRDLVPIAIIITLVLFIISYTIAQYNHLLLQTARIDDVTNLPNVKMFQEIFYRNTKRPACCFGTLFLFDIDNFKSINDTFGHLFGNTILYRISEIAKDTISSKGLVARWGGDEFVWVVYCSYEDADEILKQIVARVAIMEDSGNVTISLGATPISGNSNLDFMISEADIAMYNSKKNGRNQVTHFDSIKL